MKGKRKLAALALSALLAMTGALAGCGAKSPESGEGSGAGGSGGNTANKNIHIMLSHLNGKYAMQAKEDDKYIKEMSKLSGYNLKVEILGHNNEYVQQMTVRWASKDVGDLVRTTGIDSAMHPGAVEQGMIHELGPLIDKYGPNLKKKIPQAAWESAAVSKDGKIYGVPAMLALPANRVMYIRQDWLEKLNMKPPKTLDEWLAYFEAVKKEDMNGDGDPNNEYGFYVRENMAYGDVFFAEFGAYPDTWYFRDGKMQPGMILPEIKEALKFWKMLYDNKYINPNLFTNKAADWEAGIKKGYAGSWKHDIINYNQMWNVKGFINQPTAKLLPLGSPQGPKGGGLSVEGTGIAFVWVIPTKTKHPEEVIKFLDWAWSDAAENFFAYGIEGYNYKVENGKMKWDPNAPENNEVAASGSSQFYQVILNPRGDGRMASKILDVNPDGAIIKEGIKIAAENVIKNDALNAPPIEALKTHPEISGALRAGTLFLEMFARVVTGKEDPVKAHDNFVKEYMSRGGEAAIKEMTDWYLKKNAKK